MTLSQLYEKWSRFISAGLMIVLGLCLMLFNRYFVADMTWWIGLILILVGLFRLSERLFRKYHAKSSSTNTISLVDAFLHMGLGIFLLWCSGDAAALLNDGFGLYQLMVGVVSLITAYLLKKDRAKGTLKELITGMVTLVWGIYSLISNHTITDNIILMGLYVLFLGIMWLIDAKDLQTPDTEQEVTKRRFRIGLPVLVTMLIPADTLLKIHHLLNKDISAEHVKEEIIPKINKEVLGDPVLDVFIHVSKGIFGSVGHVDVSYKGRVYSYGSYDVDSVRLLGSVGDGCFFTLAKEDYLQYCMDYGKTLFEYQVVLTKEQQEAFEKKLNHIYDMTIPCQLTSQKQKASYLGKMVARFPTKTYKFTESRFKTYFVLGTNCVLLADELIGTSGLDLIAMEGILSPGTYYEYFHRQYESPNSIVVGEVIHNAHLEKDTK
ncbi:HdeD family acid-resistance protein [Streptococcus sp. zg-JUN1979]|uniref:HdeD family acid-resistance protein n=1 Tax=Streptococcus sp. zg-JUN1979 TaxID=3391450 RepID=UPI0039A57376